MSCNTGRYTVYTKTYYRKAPRWKPPCLHGPPPLVPALLKCSSTIGWGCDEISCNRGLIPSSPKSGARGKVHQWTWGTKGTKSWQLEFDAAKAECKGNQNLNDNMAQHGASYPDAAKGAMILVAPHVLNTNRGTDLCRSCRIGWIWKRTSVCRLWLSSVSLGQSEDWNLKQAGKLAEILPPFSPRCKFNLADCLCESTDFENGLF